MNQDLLKYVQAAKQGGSDAAASRSSLLQAGWPAAEVEEAIAAVFGGAPAVVAAASTDPVAPVAQTAQPTTASAVPAEIAGWNWGAFLLTFIWGLAHRVWISLLVFIPVVNLVWFIVLGLKGNEWAWKAKTWSGVNEFKAAQRKWAIAGFIIFGLSVVIAVISVIFAVSALSGAAQATPTVQATQGIDLGL